MLITLPFILLLLDFWPLNRLRFDEPRIKKGRTDFNRVGFLTLVVEKIPLLLLSVISVFISVTSVKGSTVSFDTVPLLLRLCNAVWSYLHYLFKFIWPVNLAVYYPYPSEIPLWQTAGAGLIVAAMTLAVIRMSVRRPYLIVGWFWYLGTLVPVSGILQVGLWPAMADRWAYIPLIGVYIIFVWGSADLVSNWPWRRAVPTVLAAIIICFFAVTAWSQTRHWQDSIALFKRAVTVTGANPVALNNLGNTYLGRGQVEEAIAQFSAAIELNPRYARALNNQGVALARKGDPNAAVDYYRRALQVIPTYAEAHNNLGAALRVLGRYAAAIVHYTKAIQLKPDYAAAHYNLALAFIHSGRPQLAVDHLHNALEINPNNTAAAETLEAALRLARSRKL
jgi:protein O-mannosyl-transferase